VPFATMQDYTSAQIYASRALSAGQPADRLGFAWAPNNTLGLTSADFNSQTGAILDRIGAAIRDSGTPSEDPGSGACAPSWCSAVVDGASLTTSWQTFGTWSEPALAVASAPVTLTAGSPAGPLSVQLQRAGVVETAQADQTVTLATTSPYGAFSTSAAGPWSSTLSVTIAAGSSSASFYYTDTAAGQPVLSAGLAGQPAVTQTETVTPAAAARITVSPAASTVVYGRSVTLVATATDTYGNAVAVAPSWTLSSTAYGRLSTASGTSTTFTAASRGGTVTATASSGALSTPVRISVVRR
jgi:hypothetical protein